MGEGYAATDYSSVQDRQTTRYRGREARQKIFFFFVFRFCLFFFTSFLNNSTIKRGTKSHQFPLVLCILLEKALKNRKRKIQKKHEGGDFFSDGHSGLQDGICEQKALFRDNL